MSITHQDNDNNPQPASDTDVVVVGAGPAGATAAYYLAQNKFRVILLDQSSFPRDKVCGDFVSPGSIKELQKMGVTEAAAFKATNVVDRATIYLKGKELVSGFFPVVRDLPRYARVVPRKVLDGLIVKAARNAGVRVLEGQRVTGYRVDNEGVTITADGKKGTQTYQARLLIGADGNNSTIAQILHGAPWSKTETALVARAYFEGVTGSPLEANVLYGDESFPGYSWLFPTGKSEANVGVGLVGGSNPPAENPKTLLLKFINSDAGLRKRLENARLKSEVEVSALNLQDHKAIIYGNRVMLVGEAAGLINPYNGEGIQMGLLSGRWAAETAAASRNSDFSESALSAYGKRVEDELGYGFRVSALMLGLLRNRNLNYAWLRWIELMGEKSKTDPDYARLTSGILSGMIFPDREEAAKALTGTLEEAALSVGVNSISEVLHDPSKLPQSAVNISQTGMIALQYAAQDPLGALRWGMDAATHVSEIAATVSKQMFQNVQSNEEKPKPKPNTIQIK